jgi:hypothetical protein
LPVQYGGKAIFATDEWFAGCDHLLQPHAPVWKEGEFTEWGKWMDGYVILCLGSGAPSAFTHSIQNPLGDSASAGGNHGESGPRGTIGASSSLG